MGFRKDEACVVPRTKPINPKYIGGQRPAPARTIVRLAAADACLQAQPQPQRGHPQATGYDSASAVHTSLQHQGGTQLSNHAHSVQATSATAAGFAEAGGPRQGDDVQSAFQQAVDRYAFPYSLQSDLRKQAERRGAGLPMRMLCGNTAQDESTGSSASTGLHVVSTEGQGTSTPHTARRKSAAECSKALQRRLTLQRTSLARRLAQIPTFDKEDGGGSIMCGSTPTATAVVATGHVDATGRNANAAAAAYLAQGEQERDNGTTQRARLRRRLTFKALAQQRSASSDSCSSCSSGAAASHLSRDAESAPVDQNQVCAAAAAALCM